MLVIRKIWWWVGLVCCCLLLLVAGLFYYRETTRVEAVPLIQQTALRAQQSRSYRYRVTANFTIGGRKQTWIKIDGEKASPTDYHFQGTILGTPVEIYQTGKRSYTLEPTSQKWVVLEGTDLSQQQIYMAELNPLSNFQFKAISNPRLLEPGQIGKQRCWVVGFRPEVENKYLEMWWKNFTYCFWVDQRSRTLARALATAENKNSPGTFLSLVVDFWDFNQKIDFKPPE